MTMNTNLIPNIDTLIQHIEACCKASEHYVLSITQYVKKQFDDTPKDKRYLIQNITHGMAWIVSYHEILLSTCDYIKSLQTHLPDKDFEIALATLGFQRYYEQLCTGVAMNQHEIVCAETFHSSHLRPQLLIKEAEALRVLVDDITYRQNLIDTLVERHDWSYFAYTGLSEQTEEIRDVLHRFVVEQVKPFSHKWHMHNEYIPENILHQLSELGVFGLTIDEEYGGMAQSKLDMCVTSTILSRGNLGVGSLGTRAEIAAEIIMCGGTEEQKKHYLPLIVSGEIIPTAVFTEPDIGSDLANIRTRAIRKGDYYSIQGNKTWITHGARANLMVLMARTGSKEEGYKGLSMFLVEKPQGVDNDFFPLEGIKGGEIETLGYRGMKEFDIAFDNLNIPTSTLLGQQEGQGFKQLMQTFESARIQTAARATGVALNALDLSITYATQRIQFGKKLIAFPRILNKILYTACDILLLDQLIYRIARQKDKGQRCDLGAGMVKLVAAKAAWAAADNALQIHGGNGFSLEYEISRVLCDARILNIFEGAAEIQAEVIARRYFEKNI